MLERIENGDGVNLFTSAGVGHARKLVNEERATLIAVSAHNTVCTCQVWRTHTVLNKLLAPGVLIGMLPPKVDPLGDYTVRLFEMIDHLRPEACHAATARSGAGPPRNLETKECRRDLGWAGGCKYRLLLRTRSLCTPSA
jgi:hypothetical protein